MSAGTDTLYFVCGDVELTNVPFAVTVDHCIPVAFENVELTSTVLASPHTVCAAPVDTFGAGDIKRRTVSVAALQAALLPVDVMVNITAPPFLSEVEGV